jgi:hypothetical protein
MRWPVYVSDGEDRQFSVTAHGGSAPNAYSLIGPCGDAAALLGIAALPGSTDAVLSLAFSPDGPLAARFCRCGLPAASYIRRLRGQVSQAGGVAVRAGWLAGGSRLVVRFGSVAGM